MPCPQTVYAAVLKSPRETIEFQMPSGSSEPFEIWLDNVSNVELINHESKGFQQLQQQQGNVHQLRNIKDLSNKT